MAIQAIGTRFLRSSLQPRDKEISPRFVDRRGVVLRVDRRYPGFPHTAVQSATESLGSSGSWYLSGPLQLVARRRRD